MPNDRTRLLLLKAFRFRQTYPRTNFHNVLIAMTDSNPPKERDIKHNDRDPLQRWVERYYAELLRIAEQYRKEMGAPDDGALAREVASRNYGDGVDGAPIGIDVPRWSLSQPI
jgi:hypothetical protein